MPERNRAGDATGTAVQGHPLRVASWPSAQRSVIRNLDLIFGITNHS